MALRLPKNGASSPQKWRFVSPKMALRLPKNGASSPQKWRMVLNIRE
jgi:hypothetical protein